MQAFLTSNKVSCNLMSLTGYRTLVILGALLESPKTKDEINECLYNNQYIQEKFSIDTLRLYINSLRAIGCDITKANKSNNGKYILKSHPFAYDIPKSQLDALAKLYKNIYDKVDATDLILAENSMKKMNEKLQNKDTTAFLKSISLLKNIDRDILNDLIVHCKNKNQIIFLYNSPKTGKKKIEIVADKLAFKSEKLYLWGNNLTHKEYSYFSVDRIIEICNIKLLKTNESFPCEKIIYEVYNQDEDYILDPDERIIERTPDRIIVEATSRNNFSLLQKILYLANNCKIIEPESFKTILLKQLKTMGKMYEKA